MIFERKGLVEFVQIRNVLNSENQKNELIGLWKGV